MKIHVATSLIAFTTLLMACGGGTVTPAEVSKITVGAPAEVLKLGAPTILTATAASGAFWCCDSGKSLNASLTLPVSKNSALNCASAVVAKTPQAGHW